MFKRILLWCCLSALAVACGLLVFLMYRTYRMYKYISIKEGMTVTQVTEKLGQATVKETDMTLWSDSAVFGETLKHHPSAYMLRYQVSQYHDVLILIDGKSGEVLLTADLRR